MNIIRAGIVMLSYLFMILIAYFILSVPITMIFDGFDDADTGEATDEIDQYLPNIRTVFHMFFAMMAAVPLTWFTLWVMKREPDWGYQ